MAALPALSVNIERLPGNARGYVAIEALSEEDIQELPAPEGVKLFPGMIDGGAAPNR